LKTVDGTTAVAAICQCASEHVVVSLTIKQSFNFRVGIIEVPWEGPPVMSPGAKAWPGASLGRGLLVNPHDPSDGLIVLCDYDLFASRGAINERSEIVFRIVTIDVRLVRAEHGYP
jgi:hypothetical protein